MLRRLVTLVFGRRVQICTYLLTYLLTYIRQFVGLSVWDVTDE